MRRRDLTKIGAGAAAVFSAPFNVHAQPRERMRRIGVLLGATPDNPSPYAANAFDCVNLIALAALQAGSTQPTAIAAMIPGVSDSGSPCTSYAECKSDMQSGNNINYDGPGGTLTVDNKGDLSSAIFQFFGFDAAGKDFIKGSVRVPPI